MPRTKRIDTDVKKRFIQAMKTNGNNRTEAYLTAVPTALSRDHAKKAGSKLFQDPEVQEMYKAAGVDLDYLSKRTKQLMDSENENIASQHVKQFNQVLLKASVTESRRLNVNLFGDLTDAQVESIRQGRKAVGTDTRTHQDVPE